MRKSPLFPSRIGGATSPRRARQTDIATVEAEPLSCGYSQAGTADTIEEADAQRCCEVMPMHQDRTSVAFTKLTMQL